MCFSEPVSFTTSVILVSGGIYSINQAFSNKEYLPFACVPLIFGIQQGFEGVVWKGINSGSSSTIYFGAMTFLFFSHWFWLFWIPFMISCLEHNWIKKMICDYFVVIGIIYGAFLYIPLLFNGDWLVVDAIRGSIHYHARFLGGSVPVELSRLLYAMIVLIPLCTSSRMDVRVWGILISFLALISRLLFNYAFVSVWCFFTALISVYIIHVVLKLSKWSSDIDRSNTEVGS
ncbi:MAG: hypothetical protein HC921_11105 [Synechococcaceae cyanobacterium SM2_3_1]|nr:hypothetical protein [Synechococcaceae cyanobacterium SM2_3_1]